MALKPFDEGALCPKCGGRDVSFKYCMSAHSIDEYEADVRTEHLHRQCARCGYEWLEATMDAAEPEPRTAT